MLETREAVRRFLEGDEEAFSRIVRRCERKVYNLAWRMTGNREDAQDVVQETFLSVFRSIRGLRDPDSFPTWLYQIALNHCRVARRRSKDLHVSLDGPESDRGGEEKEILKQLPAVQDAGNRLETLDIIQKALAGLSEDHRTAIVLKEYLGLNLEELAGVMECPLSTAKSRLYHGLQGVQRNLRRLGLNRDQG